MEIENNKEIRVGYISKGKLALIEKIIKRAETVETGEVDLPSCCKGSEIVGVFEREGDVLTLKKARDIPQKGDSLLIKEDGRSYLCFSPSSVTKSKYGSDSPYVKVKHGEQMITCRMSGALYPEDLGGLVALSGSKISKIAEGEYEMEDCSMGRLLDGDKNEFLSIPEEGEDVILL